MILSSHPAVSLTFAEVRALRTAVAFWQGLNQNNLGPDLMITIRHFTRRLDVVLTEMTSKPAGATWRLEGLDVRTLAVIRAALRQTPGLSALEAKFA